MAGVLAERKCAVSKFRIRVDVREVEAALRNRLAQVKFDPIFRGKTIVTVIRVAKPPGCLGLAGRATGLFLKRTAIR